MLPDNYCGEGIVCVAKSLFTEVWSRHMYFAKLAKIRKKR